MPKCARKRTKERNRGNVSKPTETTTSISSFPETLCRNNQSRMEQSKRRVLVANDGSWGDEKDVCIYRKEIPGYDKVPDLDEDPRRVFVPPSQDQQGPVYDNGGNIEDSRVVRLKERSRTILAGASHLLEDWEPKRLPYFGSEGGGDRGCSPSTQDCKGDTPDEPDSLLLECKYAGGHPGWFDTGATRRSDDEALGGNAEKEEGPLAFNKKDGDPDLHRLQCSLSKYTRDHSPQGRRDAPELCRHHSPNFRQGTAAWDGYLPCPVYLEDPKQHRERCPADVLKWELHAPPVEPTTLTFDANIARWLSVNSFTKDLASGVNEYRTVEEQVRKATCDIPDKFLEELLSKGIAARWGDTKTIPPNTMFIGNVFLHPEEEKKRWRLIYHPIAFNKVVRERKLQAVKLPRMRGILKQVTKYKYTVKVDLKCAFFQIPLESGIFVFRKGKELYTLTRLPMGASISVLIAQSLSLKVAGEFMRQLGGALLKGETTAFVDDIFCSFDLRDRTVGCAEELITEAMTNAVRKLNVTLKIFQVCTYPLALSELSYPAQQGLYPSSVGIRTDTENGGSGGGNVHFDVNGKMAKLKLVESFEVLGIEFNPTDMTIKMKDAFKTRARPVIESVSLPTTPLSLWELAGSCFYVIYALGICPARFYSVFSSIGTSGHPPPRSCERRLQMGVGLDTIGIRIRESHKYETSGHGVPNCRFRAKHKTREMCVYRRL